MLYVEPPPHFTVCAVTCHGTKSALVMHSRHLSFRKRAKVFRRKTSPSSIAPKKTLTETNRQRGNEGVQ